MFKGVVSKKNIFILSVLCFVSSAVFAEEKSYVIDWGVGLGGQYLNDYRGSKESQFNALPFPIVIYHGDILKIDENEGVRAEILRGKRFELNLSGDSALRSSSDDNKLREGMPVLDTAFQLGPTFNILLQGEEFEDGLALRFPLRAVVTLDTNNWAMDYIGYTFSPELTFKKKNVLSFWDLKLSAGPIYNSRKYHDYYYGISEQYVTDTRAAYTAKAGYSGFFSEIGFIGWKKNWVFRCSLRYDNLSGAEFLESDLVETEGYFSAGFGIGWMFHTSRF